MDDCKMLNPFALGGVVRGDRFAGRKAEIDRLRDLAAGGHNIFLFAPRKYGKTSLLLEALEPESDAGRQRLIWCDCLPSTDAVGFTSRIVESVVRAARLSRIKSWMKEAAGLFRTLRPNITMDAAGNVRVGVDLVYSDGAVQEGLEDAIQAVHRLAVKGAKPTAVVFDEFQKVAEWDADGQAQAILRTAIQAQEDVAYMFAGSERHLLQQLFEHRNRPLFKLAGPFPLGRLTSEELSPWLTDRFRDGGFDADTGSVNRIVQTTMGHPWATQYLAHFVWEHAQRKNLETVDEAAVLGGIELALKVGDSFYGGDLSRLTPSQRRVLTAISVEPTGSPTAAKYLMNHRLPSKSTVSQAIHSLALNGLIETQDEKYVPADPLFGLWLLGR